MDDGGVHNQTARRLIHSAGRMNPMDYQHCRKHAAARTKNVVSRNIVRINDFLMCADITIQGKGVALETAVETATEATASPQRSSMLQNRGQHLLYCLHNGVIYIDRRI